MADDPGPAIACIRAFLAANPTFSETASSLASKLRVDTQVVRQVLEEGVEAGEIQRRTFERGIEPIYYRYPTRGS
jgi:hypothetical protein